MERQIAYQLEAASLSQAGNRASAAIRRIGKNDMGFTGVTDSRILYPARKKDFHSRFPLRPRHVTSERVDSNRDGALS